MNSVLWLGVDVLKAIKGHGPSDWEAYGVSIDTRTLKKGDIFFALAGPNYDGHQFISEAIKKGASVIISWDIKNLKPVEPYKAKGIKEKGQFVLRKEGKKK